jgi:hypothetical protein
VSNSIFPIPALPSGSRGWDIGKYPVFNTIIQTPISRRGETRISTTPYCTWDFQMTFPYVKGTFNDSTSYLNQIAGFYMQMQGAANSWLYDDPQDNTITTPVTFGTGDGVTTSFQLSRPIGSYADIIQNLNGTPSLFLNGTNITTRNLIPDSDGTAGTWLGSSLMVLTPGGGAVTGSSWIYTGSGAASSFVVRESQTFNVVPGQTYTLSAYIDASHVTSGGPFIAVENPALTTAYNILTTSAGVNGRISGIFTIPGGVTQVRVIFDTNNCIVASGQPLVFSDPQLELGSSATAYQSTNQTGYSINSLGGVTFNAAPSIGASLAWTGKYYFRCRFKNDSLDQLKQIFTNHWTIQTLEWNSILL